MYGWIEMRCKSTESRRHRETQKQENAGTQKTQKKARKQREEEEEEEEGRKLRRRKTMLCSLPFILSCIVFLSCGEIRLPW
jgi:amino acid permease